jgi:hypothetical protein
MRTILDFLRADDLPLMARPNYWCELRHMLLWAIVVGGIEGNIASIVVSNTFNGSELLTTVVWAIPLLANVLNLFWGVMIRGRRRLPTFLFMAGCAVACILSIALTSSEWAWGGWCFAAQLTATHFFMSGLITLRTSLWKLNYPQSHRARIAGRLQTLWFTMALMTGAALGLLFDHEARYYRFAYPAVALIGLLSLWPLRRLRIRGENRELRRLRQHLAHVSPSSENRRTSALWSGLKETGAILARDRAFTGYMFAQFLLGSANFVVDPVLINVLTKQLFVKQYFVPNLLMYQIPIAVLLVAIRFWARFFDRVGVVRFRIYNSATWIGSYVCVTAAMVIIGTTGPRALAPAIALLVCGRVLNGISRGGGAIAWHLGHLHFAAEHQADLYMSIHVALTGLRGLLMPLAGWAIHAALGWGAFVVAAGLALTAHLLFRRLWHADRRAALADEAHAQELTTSAARADAT